MADISTHLLVIGAGPGGYVTAIRAGQLGIDTTIVDAGSLGGTCLNVGCIPSKALIHAADEYKIAQHFSQDNSLGISTTGAEIDLGKTVAWKDKVVGKLTNGVGGLLKKAKVRVVPGRAKFLDGKTVEVTDDDGSTVITARSVVIATGSEPIELPFLPFGGPVISSTAALSFKEVPKNLVVVGAGYIGLELGIAYAKFGAKVSIVEAEANILPTYDKQLTKPVLKTLADLGVDLYLGCKAKELNKTKTKLVIEQPDGSTDSLPASYVLITVGRKPTIEGWGRDNLVLDMDGRFIRINERCETSMRGVYAIGDVTGEPMLAHRAMAQGEMVAEIIAGQSREWDKRAIPAVCFTDPEIISVGLLPSEAKTGGRETLAAEFPFLANGRALSMESDAGFVRIVADKHSHVVLGIQAVGKNVSELATAFGLAIEMAARLEDIAGTIHAHPTQGEGLQEAALKALGHAIHI